MTGKTSGVPDDLLTGPPDKFASPLQAAIMEVSKVDISSKHARTETRRHIVALRDSEAWALVKAFYRGEQERLMEAIASLSNPNQMLKDSGELKLLRQFLRWPEMMLNTMAQMDAGDDQLAVQKEQDDARRNQERPSRR